MESRGASRKSDRDIPAMTRKELLEELKQQLLEHQYDSVIESFIIQAFEVPFPNWLSFTRMMKEEGHAQAYHYFEEWVPDWASSYLTDYAATTALIRQVLPDVGYCAGRARDGTYWADVGVDGVSFYASHPKGETWALISALVDAVLATH